jgi:putative ABC transport system permease protein
MPDWKSVVRERIASLHLEAAKEADLTEEIAQHLEDHYRELCSAGATKEEAYLNAVSELNDIYPLRVESGKSQRLARRDPVPAGDTKRANVVEDFWRDLRHAFRTMRRSPVFVLFVVVTLGLGIGANSTVFTVVNTLLLNPLPVANADELASVAATETQRASTSSTSFPISYADLTDYQAGNNVFRSLAGYTSPRGVTWQEGGASQGLFCELVTGNYFSTLGLIPARGRFFSAEEDTAAGVNAVAVMNYGTWQTRFGGSEDIIGKTVRLNNIVFTVVGVAPSRFIGVNAIMGPDLWIPATMAEQLLPNQMRNALSDRSKAVFLGVGRFKPGVTQARAQANMEAIASALTREYPVAHEGHTATVQPIRDAIFAGSSTTPKSIRYASGALLIVVGIVLLIACSNVANLLLARSASRQQEVAVRLAIGASRQRLMRQLLTESMFLGVLSGIVGLLISYAGLRVLFGQLPAAANFVQPRFDPNVFLFAMAVSLATGFLVGSIPALKASHSDVAEALKEEARTTGRSQRKATAANALLVSQVAFSFLLLVMAALFLQSVRRAYEIDPGFQTAHLAVFVTNPGQAAYTKPQATAFYQEVRERVSEVPGVESVSWASNMPLWASPATGLQVEGWQARSQADTIRAVVNTVDRGYFQTAGVGIRSGREFTDLDQENSAPVAIVNEKMEQDYWPAGAIGRRIQLPGEKRMRQIVGVAKTANYSNWGESPQLCVYVPLAQSESDSLVLYVRSERDPQEILNPVEREIRGAGPQVLMSGRRTGSQIIDGGLFQVRMGVALLSVFGLLALVLASIGLYGIQAYSVTQRKREIGLRMAVGAGRASVLRLILQQGMSLVLTGVLIGFVATLFVGRLLSTMLYGVSPSDPLSIAVAAGVLLAVALLACYLPARRATRIDPIIALREG